MSWSIQTHGMPKISCFADAERVWAAAKPWRNEDDNIRPLACRRKKHMAIVKLGNDRGFACQLFKTEVVTYHNNGDVILRCHDTISTNAFAWYVAPNGCSPTSFKGKMFWECDTPDGARFYRQGREALQLTPAGSSWELLTVPYQPVEWRYDPAKGAAVRKRLKLYTSWHKVTERLGILPPYVGYLSNNRHAVTRLMAQPNFEDTPFSEILESAGTPAQILPIAYEIAGAHYKAFVPHDRLPRNSA